MSQPLDHLVVVVPGIMGSVLQDREGREVWSTSLRAVVGGLLTFGRRIRALELPAGVGDDHPGDGVRATALMPDLHVVPGLWSVEIGYAALRDWLRRTFDVVTIADATAERPANYLEFPYDWRLSNRYNARALGDAVEPVLERLRAVRGNEDVGIVFVAHSMGGLVVRYYVDVLGGHEITRKVVTLGTPHRGALNALESLVNGVRKGFGPVGTDLSAFSRSLPALYQLLPEYACIAGPSGLLKTTETTVPELDTAMTADAMAFHRELEDAARGTAEVVDAHPVLARTQPTATTARLVDGRVEPLLTIDGQDQRGDGTVPRLSAAPYGVASDDPILRYVMDKHGHLPASDVIQVELEGVLSGSPDIPRRIEPFRVGVLAQDVLLAGEPLEVTVSAEPGLAIEVVLDGAPGAAPGVPAERRELLDDGDGVYRTTFAAPPPGGYELRARATAAAERDAVTTPVAVFAPV
ncbi:lipase/acyltransferase domain-containing protein [Georgenia daeguensis]|uniref:Lecithin:cholesterol acyltransferase n=1 Tax=Georgenia daeguensis TaxID=908355 RepID=A0ABP8EUJ3_9MICO